MAAGFLIGKNLCEQYTKSGMFFADSGKKHVETRPIGKNCGKKPLVQRFAHALRLRAKSRIIA